MEGTTKAYYRQLDRASTELTELVKMIDEMPQGCFADMMQELDVYSRGLGYEDIEKVQHGLDLYISKVVAEENCNL